MPSIVEFRVPMNLTVAEFERAWLFMCVESSCDSTGGGEGVLILKNEPYDNTDGSMGISQITGRVIPRTKGQYTLKEYHFASKVPGFIKALLPTKALMLVEEAFNAYPSCDVRSYFVHASVFVRPAAPLPLDRQADDMVHLHLHLDRHDVYSNVF